MFPWHILFQFDSETVALGLKVSGDVRDALLLAGLGLCTLSILDLALLLCCQSLVVHPEGSGQLAPETTRLICLLLVLGCNDLGVDLGCFGIKVDLLLALFSKT
jgi:hypothetical protein